MMKTLSLLFGLACAVHAHAALVWTGNVANCPRDRNSHFHVVNFTGSRVITWTSVPGKSYEVWATGNLSQPFAPVSGTISATGTLTSYAAATGTYFKVKVLP